MSEVLSCVEFKKWNDKPIYKVELSDGRSGESFQNIPKGTADADLEIQEGQYGLKIKHIKKNGFSGAVKQRAGNESFALSYAKDLVVSGKVEIKDILPIADK